MIKRFTQVVGPGVLSIENRSPRLGDRSRSCLRGFIMFGWFKRRKQHVADRNEPMVTVFLNPLIMLLAGAERQKGSPLTEAEVLNIRDTAVCVQMTQSQANKFYESLDLQMPIPRLNPESIWDEWQAVCDKIQ